MNFGAVMEVLSRAGVECILIGGVAASAHGSARVTFDIDFVYNRTPENIARLVGALAPFKPYLRGAPEGLPFVFDAETVKRGLNFTLATELGPIDLLGEVAGIGFYSDLLPLSLKVELFGMTFPCADIEALITMKRAAGRKKDTEAVAELEELLERRRLENEE